MLDFPCWFTMLGNNDSPEQITSQEIRSLDSQTEKKSAAVGFTRKALLIRLGQGGSTFKYFFGMSKHGFILLVLSRKWGMTYKNHS